jgi:hypothetical protein
MMRTKYPHLQKDKGWRKKKLWRMSPQRQFPAAFAEQVGAYVDWVRELSLAICPPLYAVT